jgi:L-aspartate oxidase
MERYEGAGDLASRDLVARAIVRESERSGAPVSLSLAHLDPEFVRRRFPTITAACAAAGLDLARDPIPVSPAAHYVMGGVETDLDGRTSTAGLFAAGEVACTGVHGANRLASNSLLEGLVFGARAAVAMQAPVLDASLTASDVAAPASLPLRAGTAAPSADEVRNLMWRDVGVLRTGPSLERAVERLQTWAGASAAQPGAAGQDPESARVTSLVVAGYLIARAALRREESRGAHFRTDFPARDDLHWKKRIADRLHVD